MSVCFFVPADHTGSEDQETECISEDTSSSENIQTTLQNFWAKVNDDVKRVSAEDFKTQVLPLARIKKIMKLDEEVKMISAEAPVLFAKAAEIFIHELTLRAWSHTEDNKRRTLQRNDIAMAISRSDQFDFLIDIVPRQEVKFNKPREETPKAVDPQCIQQQQTVVQNSSQLVTQPAQCAQVIQQPAQTSASSTASQSPVTLLHQVVTSSGEVQNMPIMLTQAQLNMIRLQVQNNPNTPIIIQASPQNQNSQGPQIIQVSSQAPHHQQQIYIAQVPSQDET
ncbi:nuclear transcription factor Y subunit gamma-like [Leptidea sinapis]|uniref:Nuclear transcription factor Y subunit gamma n=1 Tax=Leptidea sinapis TaxID=189913 RepID=A0A5E4QAQ3_9NEOP|nr:nuclear transcription factor Y subunit gamma-like [Leptidea sinapis]VVC94680.1 unnamed protein product [Leptidea sinapis]